MSASTDRRREGTSRHHPRTSHNVSTTSTTGWKDLQVALPENTVSEDNSNDSYKDEPAKLPWWKRPSPWWLIIVTFLSAMSVGATVGPRIELYTKLACKAHKPEYTDPDTLGLMATYAGPRYHNTNPNLCASDPDVQAAAAKLMMVMTALLGVLSCITVAWWGSFSDRHGRTMLMTIAFISLLLSDANLIFVSLFSTNIPGGYWFLVVGPAIAGSAGGMTSAVTAMKAYVSDTTNPAACSRMFSLFIGLSFAGGAIGPMLGVLVTHITHNVLSVFYASIIMLLVCALFSCLIIPESVSRSEMAASRIGHQEELENLKEARDSIGLGILVLTKRMFGFLTPLALFIPATVVEQNPAKSRRNWTLTLIAAGYGITNMISGSDTSYFQYAAFRFQWSFENIGYFIAISSISNATFLTVILPVTIKFLKSAPQLPPEAGTSQSLPVRPSSSFYFDLNLARASLLMNVACYTLIGFAPNSGVFIAFTLISSFAQGFSPALHGVALELYSRRGGKENGKLFGALDVINTLCAQIIGPAIFGFTYIRSVAVFPPAIFFLSTCAALSSLILLSFVRLTEATVEAHIEDQTPSTVHEGLLVDLDPELGDANADMGRKAKAHGPLISI